MDTLETAISEKRGTLEDMVESYLIQQDFIMLVTLNLSKEERSEFL
ncbi:hypothetical protein [Candidatus Ruthturnera calyptogenae]